MAPPLSRRRALHATGTALGLALSGCSGGKSDAAKTTTTTAPPPVTVESVTVADFITYLQAGTHERVHRSAETQYVIVTVSGADDLTPLSLELDDEEVDRTEKRAVRDAEGSHLAFAVSKDRTVESGTLRYDGRAVESLATETVERLNTPPTFRVENVGVTPDEFAVGSGTTPKVKVAVKNNGSGPGTFGASLTSDVISGYVTMSATIEPGGTSTMTETVPVIPQGDAIGVTVDWGADSWTGTIDVEGTPTPFR
jgi:hypothetical protein